MRGYQKRIKKMLAVLLVISVAMSVIRPQLKSLVFAEEAVEETVSENGTIDDGTPVDVTSEITTDENNAEVDMTDEVATEETEKSDAVSDKAVADAEDTAANGKTADTQEGFSDATVADTESAINQEEQTEDYKVDTANDTKTEDLDLSETEAVNEESDNEAHEAVKLTARVPESGCDITINAPEGSLPYPADELSLSARELVPGTLEYALYLQATAMVLEQENANDISFARFFDIEILKDGEKVEPLKSVEVKICYDDAPEIAEEDEFSIVHFASQGTEVINDVELNEDATEIVYEQGSFSVTATVVTTTTVPSATATGKAYALVAECDGKVYVVQGDGTLTEVESFEKTGDIITSVKTNNPMFWTYVSEGRNTYLRYAAEGYDFNWTQQAQSFAMGYIDPTNPEGVSTEQVDHVESQPTPHGESPTVTYFDNTKDHCGIILNDQRQIYHDGTTDLYIAVDKDNNRLSGNLNMASDAAKITKTKFYLADVNPILSNISDGDLAKNHMVNHIDISVSDQVSVDLPLAYGVYYNAAGKVILTIDRNSPDSMKKTTVTKTVNVEQEYLRTAKIETSCNGVPIDDAFYITGYSSNAPSGYSGTQVRIEGRFKVANLAPVATSNPDDTMIERLKPENQIRYKITAIQPNEEFTYTHPVTGEVLYDANGMPITTTGNVTISAEFGYWDYDPTGNGSSNECPPIQADWGDGTDFRKWRAGAIQSIGTSGMDFKLSGEATVNIRPYAIEIENKIIDADGNPIIPRDKITGFKFGVYVDQSGNPDSVVGKNVGGYNGYDANTASYGYATTKTMDIDNDPSKNATNIVYEYELPEGMVYIDEDKTTVPEFIVDKDGNRWVYKKTFIETEYVWRNGDSNNNGRHFSKDYNESDAAFNSVPEVVGTYGDEFNEFLEFYVRNVYEKIKPPTKQEISPYEGNGSLGGVDVGDEITYEISYKNYKNAAADVVIKDKLDNNVEFESASDSGVYDDTTHTVTWTLKDVASDKSGKVTLKVKVLEGALTKNGGPGYVVNGGDTSTVQVGNDDAYTLDPVENPVPKTSVKKEVFPYEGTGKLGGVNVGDRITYEIDYKNYKDVAADVVIKDKLDANVKYISSTDGGVYDEATHTVTWTIKEVPAGNDGKVSLVVKVLEGALEKNGGPGEVANGGITSTVKIGNDKEYSLDKVVNPVPKFPAKREIAPYEGIGTLGAVKVGDEITYEILFKNYKNAAADVIIKDKLDVNVEFVSASDDGVYDAATHTVTWTIKAVPADEEGRVTLKVKVLEGALASKGGPGKVVNGGKTSTVKIGNDPEYELELVENPVPETSTVTPPSTSTVTPPDSSTNTSVKTGDKAPVTIMIWLILISIAGIVLLRNKKEI